MKQTKDGREKRVDTNLHFFKIGCTKECDQLKEGNNILNLDITNLEVSKRKITSDFEWKKNIIDIKKLQNESRFPFHLALLRSVLCY